MYYFLMITGFPSPAQGYEDKGFDLNKTYIKHPAATVFMTVDTTKYTRFGIYNGDLLIVDRSKKAAQNSLVVYTTDCDFNIGRVYTIQDECQITGVITHVIHTVKES